MSTKRLKTKLLPRVPDKDPSPAGLAITQHYANLGVKKLWNQDRVKRLKNFMRVDDHFLAAMLNMPYAIYEKQLRDRNVITGSAALLLCIIEDFLMGEFVNDTVKVFDIPGMTDG